LRNGAVVISYDQGRTYLGRDGKRYKMPFGAIKGYKKFKDYTVYTYKGGKYHLPTEDYIRLTDENKPFFKKIANNTKLTPEQKLEKELEFITAHLTTYRGKKIKSKEDKWSKYAVPGQ